MTSTSKSDALDPIADYAQFVTSELSDGVASYNIPDYNEFINIREKMSDPDTLQAFAIPSTASGLLSAGMSNPTIRRLAKSAIDAGVSEVSKEGQRIAQRISQQLKSGESFVKVKKSFGDTGGNSGTTAGGDGSSRNPFNLNRMNYNPKPVQVRLDTGLRSKGYGDYYPESREGLAVLELTTVEFLVPTSAASALKDYFDTVIAFNFQNEAQMSVSFNVNAQTNFSSQNLMDWMNRYSTAYSKYVMYTTIINYCNEPLQQNSGMRALRSMITPQLLDDLSQLGSMLDGTPVPPKFRELIHFIYGAPFKVSNNPGSTIRMIMATPLISADVGSGVFLPSAFPESDIKSSIDGLFDVRNTTALIARVCPSWIPGKGNTPSGATVPEYSPNWSTLFENLPWYLTASNSGQRWGPEVASEIEDSLYGSSADTLDGAITALWNGYMPSSGVSTWSDKFRPGTLIPIPTSYPYNNDPGQIFYSNRLSYHYDPSGGLSRFKPIGTVTHDAYARCETYVLTASNQIHKTIWPGREVINNINVASARQTCYELYSRMFEMTTKKPDNFFENKSSNRGSRKSARRRKKSDNLSK